jgi:hypothetical protein
LLLLSRFEPLALPESIQSLCVETACIADAEFGFLYRVGSTAAAAATVLSISSSV